MAHGKDDAGRDVHPDHRGVGAGPASPWSGPAAGVVAGLAGLAVFLSLHAAWILPIWSVAGLGLAVAVVGGAAAGWAYGLLRHRVPRHPVAAWLAVTAGAVALLTPSIVLAWLGGPYAPIVDGVPVVPAESDLPELVARFVVELLVVTSVAGTALGWALTRSRRAALATGAAALAFALGPGHNNPFFFRFGSAAATYAGAGLVLAVIATAGAVLVLLDRLLVAHERSVGEARRPTG